MWTYTKLPLPSGQIEVYRGLHFEGTFTSETEANTYIDECRDEDRMRARVSAGDLACGRVLRSE